MHTFEPKHTKVKSSIESHQTLWFDHIQGFHPFEAATNSKHSIGRENAAASN